MIFVSTELQTLLRSSDQFLMADLYTFTLSNGLVLRYVGFDVDIVVEGNTFSSSLKIDRDNIKVCTGLEVDSFNLTIFPELTDLVDGKPFLMAVCEGQFDGAIVLIERAFFMSSPFAYVGKIHRFLGIVGELSDFSATQIPMTVNSYLQLLNVNMPRNLYQPTCRRALFDVGCTLVKSSFAVAGVAAAIGSTQNTILALLSDKPGGVNGILTNYAMGYGNGQQTSFTTSLPYAPLAVGAVYFNGGTLLSVTNSLGLPQSIWYSQSIEGPEATLDFDLPPDTGTVITADFPYAISGWYDLGVVTFTSGANTGVSRTVKQFIPGIDSTLLATLTFTLPWPHPITSGDLFTIYPGCNKQKSTCASSKFNNLQHFSAEPYIPVPETAY